MLDQLKDKVLLLQQEGLSHYIPREVNFFFNKIRFNPESNKNVDWDEQERLFLKEYGFDILEEGVNDTGEDNRILN